jgi:hypothetical protein
LKMDCLEEPFNRSAVYLQESTILDAKHTHFVEIALQDEKI